MYQNKGTGSISTKQFTSAFLLKAIWLKDQLITLWYEISQNVKIHQRVLLIWLEICIFEESSMTFDPWPWANLSKILHSSSTCHVVSTCQIWTKSIWAIPRLERHDLTFSFGHNSKVYNYFWNFISYLM